MAEHEIDVPLWKGKPPLTLNQRLHWREKAERTRVTRHAVGFRAVALHLPPTGHVSVQLHYATGDQRRRDTDNLVATLKPCVDGLVDAGLVPDDDPGHVTTIMPAIHNGPGPRRLWITINITNLEAK